MAVWKTIYKRDNLTAKEWQSDISLIRTVDGEDTEIIVDKDDIIEICKKIYPMDDYKWDIKRQVWIKV